MVFKNSCGLSPFIHLFTIWFSVHALNWYRSATVWNNFNLFRPYFKCMIACMRCTLYTVCMYVYVCLCMFVYVYVCMFVYACLSMYVCVRIFVYACLCMHVNVCLFVYPCMCVCSSFCSLHNIMWIKLLDDIPCLTSHRSLIHGVNKVNLQAGMSAAQISWSSSPPLHPWL